MERDSAPSFSSELVHQNPVYTLNASRVPVRIGKVRISRADGLRAFHRVFRGRTHGPGNVGHDNSTGHLTW